MRTDGHYFAPGSARIREAALERSGEPAVLKVVAEGMVLAEAPISRMRISPRLGRLARKLDFPDGGRFETNDDDGIDALLGRPSLLHRLERSWRMVLVSLALAAGLVAWFLIQGAPMIAAFLARHTPMGVSQVMTRETLSTLDGRALKTTRLPLALQKREKAIFAEAAARQADPKRYRLLLRDAPLIGPNAFAFPDGSIVLTDQLAVLARDNDEIEGVFAHEMAHVARAHVLQRVYQVSLVPAAIALVTGDASQVAHAANLVSGMLLQASYSRAFEQEADDDAARLLAAEGRDPGKLADLLQRLDRRICAGSCGPSWLGSHPATAARAERLRHWRGKSQ